MGVRNDWERVRGWLDDYLSLQGLDASGGPATVPRRLPATASRSLR